VRLLPSKNGERTSQSGLGGKEEGEGSCITTGCLRPKEGRGGKKKGQRKGVSHTLEKGPLGGVRYA